MQIFYASAAVVA